MFKAYSLAFLASMMLLCSAAQATETVLYTAGNAWETGGFPTSDTGDELQAVGILTNIGNPLVWNTVLYSYTWYMRGLISVGESMNGTTHIATYTGGQITFYVDSKPSNHDYGTNPPNVTSPSTFQDGLSTYLDGVFTDFTMTWTQGTGTGSFTGELEFTGGDVFPLLTNATGWTFGGTIAGFSPVGYDLEVNGQVFIQGPSGTDEATWGSIKNLYR